jgi:hypothetical protein
MSRWQLSHSHTTEAAHCLQIIHTQSTTRSTYRTSPSTGNSYAYTFISAGLLMPDLNSLPKSPSLSNMAEPTSLPLSHSLAAAAALNAGLHSEDSRHSSSGSLRGPRRDRRRSSVQMSLTLNDPSLPGPGELQMSPGASRSNSNAWPSNPTHNRNPSLGELHQELENEQENQVVSRARHENI